MSKDATITVRVPQELKEQLTRRATAEHRSISAQVLRELELAVARDEPSTPRAAALGLFASSKLPSDRDLREIRRALWGRLSVPGEP